MDVAGILPSNRASWIRTVALLAGSFGLLFAFRSDPDKAFTGLALLWSTVAGLLVAFRTPSNATSSARAWAMRVVAVLCTFVATEAVTRLGAWLLKYPPSWRAAVAAGIASAIALVQRRDSDTQTGSARAKRVLAAVLPPVIAALLAGPVGKLLPGVLLPMAGATTAFPVTSKGRVALIGATGKPITGADLDSASPTGAGPFLVQSSHRWAFIDASGRHIGWETVTVDGKSVERPKFAAASAFAQGLAAASIEVKDKGTLWGYVDTTGQFVIQPQFWSALDFANDRAPVLVPNQGRGTWGYVDKTGNFAIKAQYDWASVFKDGFARIGWRSACPGCDVDKYQLLDPSGRVLTEQQYDYIGEFAEGLVEVGLGGKMGFLDTSGRVVIKPTFDAYYNAEGNYYNYYTCQFSEGLAAVPSGKTWGFIDTTGKLVIPATFTSAQPFKGQLARVWTDAGAGYVDKTGKIVIPPQFSWADDFVDGLALVFLRGADGKQGKGEFIDPTGKVVIAPAFDGASHFSHGLAAVSVAGKWGYVDQRGSLVIRPVFDSAADFDDPIARVTIDNREAYIDRAGRYVWKPDGGTWQARPHVAPQPSGDR